MAWGYDFNAESDFKSPFFGPQFFLPWAAVSPIGGSATATKSATPSSVSTTSKTTASLPAWISGLKDAALRTDFTSFYSAGAVTEAEMAKALGDLASELGAAKVALSASQVADLKSIASNIGSMGASSYLQSITNAFVNGNPANAKWTGGAANSVTLGNLAAGYTVNQLNELIGKWFLGTDLPSDTVSMSGAATFTVSYSTVKSPLFGTNGPSMSDINQGYLGDCYLLSALAEVASQDPTAITSMITNNGNGTYGVRFYVNGAARYVTVDNQLANGGRIFNSASNIWASVVEEAYAEVQAQGVITGNSVNYGNSFSTIGNGGCPEFTLEEITGATAITDFYANGSSWLSYTFNQELNATSYKSGLSTTSVLSSLAADLLVGDDLDLGSNTTAKDTSGKYTLISDHAMSIYGYDASTGLLEIRNPWGAESGQNWDTTFEVSLNTLLSANDTITADNAGTTTSVSGASVVAAPTLQAMAQVKSIAVTDSAVHIDSGLAGLIGDSKLTSVTANGGSGADLLTLTGLKVAATINLEGNSDSATVSGFVSKGTGVGAATSLNLGSGYDTIALGLGNTTTDFSLGAGGVESISAFNAAHDLLSIALNGGSLEQTLVNGGDWISSSTDLRHGVFLAGVTATQKATVSNGFATVA